MKQVVALCQIPAPGVHPYQHDQVPWFRQSCTLSELARMSSDRSPALIGQALDRLWLCVVSLPVSLYVKLRCRSWVLLNVTEGAVNASH